METGRRPARRYVFDFWQISCCMLSGAVVAVVRCRGCDDVRGWWAAPRPAPPRTTKYYYYLYLYTKYKPRRSNDTDYSRVASPVTCASSSWWETRTPPICFYFSDTVAHCRLPSRTVAAATPLRPLLSRVLLVVRCCCFCWHRRPVVDPVFWSKNRSAADFRGLPPSSSSSVWTCSTNGKRIHSIFSK